LAAVAAYSATIAFLPWAGLVETENAVTYSSYIVIGFIILAILAFVVYLNNNLRRSDPTVVQGEQVLPSKLRYLPKPLGTGRRMEAPVQVEKRDRRADNSCRDFFVKDLCTTCVHHRRRYYGNYCKHFGMVVDRPGKVAA
jgi:hypothetical protein